MGGSASWRKRGEEKRLEGKREEEREEEEIGEVAEEIFKNI